MTTDERNAHEQVVLREVSRLLCRLLEKRSETMPRCSMDERPYPGHCTEENCAVVREMRRALEGLTS